MGRKLNTQAATLVSSQQSQGAQTILRDNSRYREGLVFDVFEYVKSLSDIELRNEPMEDNISGWIKKQGLKYIISINSMQNPLRQRFTLAHELGHYYYHRNELEGQHTDITLFRDVNVDQLGIEYAANEFAAELLMPEVDFRKAIQNGENTPKLLSQLFQVTEKAVLYRAYKLGIVRTF